MYLKEVKMAKSKKDREAKLKSTKSKQPDAAKGKKKGDLYPQRLDREFYEGELANLQIELFKLQEWIVNDGRRVIVLFEGRDAAGKGGVITRITENLNPRVCRVIALPKPTERERTQWYFQRYISHFPAAGEIVLFDRSWYNRAGVERVMGFCSNKASSEFIRSCPEFERMLVRSGIIVIKSNCPSAPRVPAPCAAHVRSELRAGEALICLESLGRRLYQPLARGE